MLNKATAYALIDKTLSFCNHYTMVTVDAKEEGLTRFANSGIHQNVYNNDTSLTVAVYKGKKEASVTTNVLDESSIKQAVKEAEENLDFIPDGEYELPELTLPPEIAVEQYEQEVSKKFDIENRGKLLKEAIDSLEDGYIAAGALSLNKTVLAMGNNRGIKRYARVDSVDFNAVVIHKDGSSGYAACNTNKAAELDVSEQFRTAFQKAKTGLDPITLEPGAYTVILEPLAVGDLLAYMSYSGFSARSVQTGLSFLTGKIGEKLFGENITVTDDVSNPNTYPLKFDFEGHEKKRLAIIEKGRVKELAYDSKSAAKDKTTTTGHSVGHPDIGGFPFNLVMEAGKDNLEDLISSTKKGLLVTRFHYMNIVDPRQAVLTALTRDGLFLIEDGVIKSGVKNLRFTESMLKAFNKVTGITAERKKVPGFFAVNYVPALKITDFHFTGKTSE